MFRSTQGPFSGSSLVLSWNYMVLCAHQCRCSQRYGSISTVTTENPFIVWPIESNFFVLVIQVSKLKTYGTTYPVVLTCVHWR